MRLPTIIEVAKPMLKFHGIYQSKIKEMEDRLSKAEIEDYGVGWENSDDEDFVYWSYLRFYRDNRVITVSSTGNPQEISDWFNRNNCDLPYGTYKLSNARLVFSATSESGTVDYKGTINKDTLSLNSFSHINGYQKTELYYFVSL